MSVRNHLVVGIKGTIGSALFNHLRLLAQTTGDSVWGTTHKEEVVKQPQIFHLNLLDSSASKLPDERMDVAYLCAGVCKMALCENDPAGTYKANVEGMAALARRLSDAGAFIVYVSTNQVFSGDEPYVLPDAPYRPLNEYGRQKSQIETLIRTYCPRSSIVRLTKVIEPEMPLIKNWIDLLTRHQPVQSFHDMMLAPVTLRQVIDVLVKVGQKQQPGCYQVSGAEDVSYYALACYLAQQLDRPLSLVQSLSAMDAGIKKSFLPRFTTLNCSSTITLGGETPPQFSDVVHECFDLSAAVCC